MQPGYESGDGCSGHTYQFGVVEAMRHLNPALLLFENVVGVAESTKDSKGNKQDPAVKAEYRRTMCF